MVRRLVHWIILATSLLVSVSAAAAQSSSAGRGATIYRLDKGSTYQYGCFGACLCPVLTAMPIRGTFVLTPAGYDGLYTNYTVTDVNWTVAYGSPELRITGSGTYRIGGEFALLQELQLILKIGDQPEQKFDSGLVPPGSAPFPAIGISVSVNGAICFDTLITLAALPVPASEIRPYQLTKDATYQTGCTGPCDCAIGPERAVFGTLLLVPLQRDLFVAEYAVVDVRWQAGEASTGAAGGVMIPIRGFGTYRTGGDLLLQQQLALDLVVGAQPLTHYDSGTIQGSDFPRLNVPISIASAVCTDTWIKVRARPRRLALSRPSAYGLN